MQLRGGVQAGLQVGAVRARRGAAVLEVGQSLGAGRKLGGQLGSLGVGGAQLGGHPLLLALHGGKGLAVAGHRRGQLPDLCWLVGWGQGGVEREEGE